MWLVGVCVALCVAVLTVVCIVLSDSHNSRREARRRRRRQQRERRRRYDETGGVVGAGGGPDGGGAQALGAGVAPVKAVYLGYADVSPADVAVRAAADAGFNLILLAFWMGPSTGADPYGALWWWSQLSPTARQSTVDYVHSKGGRILLSAGGAGYTAYPASGAVAFGQGAAAFANANLLDGIDFDFENFTSSFGTPTSGLNKAQTIQWMTDATNAGRSALTSTYATITHAPQSPYWNVEFVYGYLDFWTQTPQPNVDLFLIQFYNQGAGAYLTYEQQFINDDNYHPGTAVAQLIAAGLPADKIVIGKTTQPGDGSTWLDPNTLHQWVERAQTDPAAHLWHTGISTWQWHASGTPTSAQFLNTVYPAT